MWRPDGWDLVRPKGVGKFDEYFGELPTARTLTPSEEALFEAGADAMLEALRKQGQPDFWRFLNNCSKITFTRQAGSEEIIIQPDTTIGKGKCVFIPDEH